MAFGFNAHFKEEYPLGNSSPIQFLVIASEAAKKLDWDISKITHTGFNAATGSSWRSRFEYIMISIETDKIILTSETGSNELYDWGRNKKNIHNFISAIEEVKASITPEELVTKCHELEQKLSEIPQHDILNAGIQSEKEKFNFLSFFRPSGKFFITPIIIDINVLLFIIMVGSGVSIFMPDNLSLLKWGANFAPYTLSGEWWRLFTCMFLHIGIFHILFNMYALLYIGLLLEPQLGRVRFTSAYILSGLVSSATSLWWNGNLISAGASGAIFGMYGVFLALLTTNIIEKSARKSLLTSIVVFVLYNLANGMKAGAGIDNAAHIGGLVSGIIIGYAFIPSIKKQENSSLVYRTIFLLTIGTVGVAYQALNKKPDDLTAYEGIMKRFTDNELKAVSIYHRNIDSLSDNDLYNQAMSGLNLWVENAKLLDSASKLTLPEKLHTILSGLRRYTALRYMSYDLMTDLAHDRHNQVTIGSIVTYNQQISVLVDSLKTIENQPQ